MTITYYMSRISVESSQDEEEEAKAVTVKFARQETAEQKSRRMGSYDYLKKKQSEEFWSQCVYHKTQVRILHDMAYNAVLLVICYFYVCWKKLSMLVIR